MTNSLSDSDAQRIADEVNGWRQNGGGGRCVYSADGDGGAFFTANSAPDTTGLIVIPVSRPGGGAWTADDVHWYFTPRSDDEW